MIKGDPRNLTRELENTIIGLRKTNLSFEGIIERGLADEIESFLIEPVTIDDVVVFTSREN